MPAEPLFLGVFLIYFTSLGLYFVNFEAKNEALLGWAQKLLHAGLFLHLAFLILLAVRQGTIFISNLSEYLCAATFLVVAFSSFLERRYAMRYLMLFSLPTALLFSLLAMLLWTGGQARWSPPSSLWLWLHTSFILLAFAGLLMSGAAAAMYLLQSYQLKSKNLGKVFLKLPPLNTLERLHFRTLFWGVLLFSLGILGGMFSVSDRGELGVVLKDPKVFLSFLTCFMYWLILAFHLSALRRGQKIAAGTILVLLLLIVTLLAPAGFHRTF